MKHTHLILVLAALSAGRAWSQTPPATETPKPAQSSPQAEAGEPRANTSAQAEAGEPRAQTSAPMPAAAAAPGKIPAAKTPAASAAARPPAAGQKAGNDRLQLGTATVTGDREQPKVMYIVPWKRSDIGDLEGKPMNSLVDEILSPVDRDVFKREVRYYQTVNSDASQSGAKPPPGQGEK